ncbi:twin-arginine translocase TatA/TatE family subunit [Homoserinibacter sp. GY 40078]|uniref:twin-arginine translocase TatA/TatE family subunit n=1 Tax=Homoserinibacter sp. GY 40078 TaxID=2603275 RepID=UPI0011C7B45F|nr:twin-arginine translocase TatA/TatE family subunit [Homoserinibacter sp. GY 40078]TXK19039.1 preprotein translocase [Homoserinibacter sp. GY 40078]
MFGLSIEKLVIVMVVAAFILGPERIPEYTRRLAELVRAVRQTLDTARTRAETEMGVSAADWEALDPRRYDPRRIVREALAGESAGVAEGATTVTAEPEERPDVADPERAETAEPDGAEPMESAAPAPPPRYVITGSSGHPRRVLVQPDPE